jgi:16S rRNA (guanine527-N7)-methyltransferase
MFTDEYPLYNAIVGKSRWRMEIAMSITIEQIINLARTGGIALNEAQATLLLRYHDLLLEWNERFNLTAITADEAILVRHFMDSLTVLRALPARVTLLDLGTGAGLPGIPLKIARPALDVTLMDSTGKKIIFCQTVIETLNLEGIRALKGRAEEAAHQPQHREQYGAVVARALAPMPTLAEYMLPFTRVGGVCVAMKGSDAQDEAHQARKAIRILGGELARVEPVTLPGLTDQRVLIVIGKVAATPRQYPRQSGKPRSSPLL